MSVDANIAEFRQLEAEIADGEADFEAMRWRQAELAATAVANDGITQREYAKAVGKHPSTISRLVRVWEKLGDTPVARGHIRFADAYAIVSIGFQTTKAELSRLERERQVPTRQQDRAEMAVKLMADPEVAKAVAPKVLDPATRSGRLLSQQVHDQEQAARQKRAKQHEEARADGALPLPAIVPRMVETINEWAIALAGVADEFDGLPDGQGQELLIRALENLDVMVHRSLDRLGRPGLRVIEGQASVKAVMPR